MHLEAIQPAQCHQTAQARRGLRAVGNNGLHLKESASTTQGQHVCGNILEFWLVDPPVTNGSSVETSDKRTNPSPAHQDGLFLELL